MQENIKISKIDKKETTIKENNKLLLKNATDLYLLDKCLKTKVHKMLERQTNVYLPTFMYFLLFEVYCEHNMRLKLGKPEAY